MSKKKKKNIEKSEFKLEDKREELVTEITPEEAGLDTVAELKETTEEKKDAASEEKSTKKKVVVNGLFLGETVVTENSDDAREFYNQSRFGALDENGKVELSLLEAHYLMEKGRLIVKSETGKDLNFESYFKKAQKIEPNFWIRYCVFKDMRNRGYIIKTALKFGADFRVYDRGVKPGEDHAKWIVYPVHESNTLTWHEFSAKNRVAHSTKKRLLLAIVDDEGDCTYYETKWMRP
ncbi:tRNA-intron lyase [Candidatus Woesearchaeota archaeon]|nr:tRNA-intron lyase [Candidatus Woesearchaeota archaeon]